MGITVLYIHGEEHGKKIESTVDIDEVTHCI